ncbi:MAG TPA: DsrE family protein [Methylomirabilota bacterium]|jgi:predicted peroxiredoxin|nr:DsrE family protein [Methylomirabilota bacterium]
MAKLLITATYGFDNSTRAAMPFFVAKGAKESGIDVGLVLALDATVLVKPEVRKHVQPYGQPPLEELFQFTVEHRIPVYV